MKLTAGLGVCAAIGAALAAWAFWIEPSRLVFREIDLEIERLPTGLAGLEVALLADLHIGAPHVGLDRLERIVAETNARRPDLILLAGDYVIQEVVGGNPVDPAEIFAVLDRLEAPLGVYAVMGNHDWWYGHDRIVAAFVRHAPRLRLLEDASVELSNNDASFRLTASPILPRGRWIWPATSRVQATNSISLSRIRQTCFQDCRKGSI